MENTGKQRVRYKIEKVPFDMELLTAIGMLSVIGLMAVFSASIPLCMTHHISPFHFFGQHRLWLALGVGGLYWFSKFDYTKLKKYTFSLAFCVIILLLIVKFTPLGVSINGARRWLNLGLFQFQPSELSKISVVMLLSSLFSLPKNLYKEKLWAYISVIIGMVFVILKQPNLSMVLILFGISLAIYAFAGKKLKYIGIGILIFCGLFALVKTEVIDLTKYLEPHQVARIMNWHNSESDLQGEGYQVFHSMIAIASGGIIGQGYGASKEKMGWLPEAHTDFIFSVISEEMGFVGSLFVILLFLMVFHRGILIALKSPEIYGKLMSAGITISITMQAFFNIAVATSFLPATGITLPFVSYGGTSLFVSLCMVGVLLNISKIQKVRLYQKR